MSAPDPVILKQGQMMSFMGSPMPPGSARVTIETDKGAVSLFTTKHFGLCTPLVDASAKVLAALGYHRDSIKDAFANVAEDECGC